MAAFFISVAHHLNPFRSEVEERSFGDAPSLVHKDNRGQVSPFDQLIQETARSCQRLIFRDEQGTSEVDFLGAEVLRHFGNADSTLLTEIVPKAYRYVEQERRMSHQTGNEKLAKRYDRLWSYLRQRAVLWGPEAERAARS